MSLAQFLPSIPGLEYRNAEIGFGLVQISAQSTQKLSACPFCGINSTKVHSSYIRQPQDLSFVGKTYRLLLHVRRFFCKEDRCPQKIFVERLGPCLPVYSRKTGRMLNLLEILGFSLGGAPGAWVAKQIGMKVSGDTILRILMKKQEPEFATPRVLGVDDWSFRKGIRFGTILVDLEKRIPIDLLPDREADTLGQWLKDHPGVEIISRDRASAYSAAAKEGAPNAIEIADRWHLLKNMGEATQRVLRGMGPLLREATRKVHGISEEQQVETIKPKEVTSQEQKELTPGESIRHTKFLEVKRMQKEGRSIRFMHRELAMHRQTIKRYMACDEFPHRGVDSFYYSRVTPYIAYLEKRWQEGMHSPKQLWREIKEQGFKGAYGSVYRMTNRLFGTGGKGRPKKKVKNPPTLSGRKASIILGKEPKKLTVDETKFCKTLQELSPDIKKAYPIIQDFVQMIKQQKVKALDPWIKKAQESEISPMVNFATGIVQDYDAVKAALEYEWSNGQVEGQVNRLKNIKRQMYGRAGFKLLRKRVSIRPSAYLNRSCGCISLCKRNYGKKTPSYEFRDVPFG